MESETGNETEPREPVPSGQPKLAAASSGSDYPDSAVRLVGWLKTIDAAKPCMFWTHRTTVDVLKDMVVNKTMLPPAPCPHYNKFLNYFFYGRPAYRQVMDDSVGNDSRGPVILFFRDTIVSRAFKIYPFDSGAYHTHRYRPWIPDHKDLADFELQDAPDAAQRYVKAFYGTNAKYWRLEAKKPNGNFALLQEVNILTHMLTDRAAKPADDRRFVVELLVEDEIPFTGEYVKAALVPHSMAKGLKELGVSEKTGVKIVPYPLEVGRVVIEYQYYLEQEARKVHRRYKVM